uniref:P-type domain-containing protein n=1 Tax=Haemonchus contortus TaxID=6289 RepID=A0A7I4Y572_HAECO
MTWLLILIASVGFGDTLRNKVYMDCYPDKGADKSKCEERGCSWIASEESESNRPWCFLKDDMGYKQEGTDGSIITLKRTEGTKSPWSNDIERIRLKTENIGKTLNVKIFADGRFEPPVDLPRNPSSSTDTLLFAARADEIFHFIIKRESTGTEVFDTSVGGLIFADKFLQIASYLPSDAMYGWGENAHPTLKHDFSKYRTWGMFARDEPPDLSKLSTKNLYGVHPFYMVIEPDGKAHGVFILNSNAQEVITAPGPAIIYRTIGGNLDLYFFPGPTPEEVTQQYLALIGTPVLPAYWALGFQLSRYGYKDLDDLKGIIKRNRDAGVPLETVVVDIDYMDRYKDFTVGEKFAGMPDYLKEVQSWGMRVILIYDPAIQVDHESFERGIEGGARFVEWERDDQVMRSIQDQYPLVKDTKIMLGVVWPDRHVAFPDFLDPTNATQKWWIQEFVRFHDKVPHDGIWIDMNEPANFGTNENEPWYFGDKDHPNAEQLRCPSGSVDKEWEVPPYQTHSVYHYEGEPSLATKTLCMTAVQGDGKLRFYDVKNLYGWSEAKATLQAQHTAMGKRGVVISRSTFPSAGRYAGHWLGDNTATWEDLRSSIIGALEFNMFGIPYIGADICGFHGKPSEELCLRWQQLGAFHPFMRNHNVKLAEPQDPAQWPQVVEATKKATFFRYKYLPYLYSLHFIASIKGGTVIRPMFYEYPNDKSTHDLSYQFLLGPSMLIAPVVYEKATSVKVYIPKDDWFSVYDERYYGRAFNSGFQEFHAPTTSLIPIFVRGGSILPRQVPNITTSASRKNPFELLIVPFMSGSNKGKAEGVLYWDDGESVIHSFATHNYYQWSFKYQKTDTGGRLMIKTERQAKSLTIPTLDTIEIFHYEDATDPKRFELNGRQIDASTYFDRGEKILHVSGEKLIDMSTGGTVKLSWSHSLEESVKLGYDDETTTTSSGPQVNVVPGSSGPQANVVPDGKWKLQINVYNQPAASILQQPCSGAMPSQNRLLSTAVTTNFCLWYFMHLWF